jgi:hypothetical protein
MVLKRAALRAAWYKRKSMEARHVADIFETVLMNEMDKVE